MAAADKGLPLPSYEYVGPAQLTRWGGDDDGIGATTIRCRLTDSQYEQLHEKEGQIVSEDQPDSNLTDRVYMGINWVRLEGTLWDIRYDYEQGGTDWGPCLDDIDVLAVG